MRNFTKRILCISMAAMMTLGGLTGCGGNKAASSAAPAAPASSGGGDAAPANGDPYADLDKVTWRFTHTQSADHFQQVAMQEFADFMKEKSGGKFTVEIFHSGTLGAEQEVLESMQTGSVAGMVAAASLLANFVPAYNMFALPALFEDEAQFEQVMTDESFINKLKEASANANLIDYGYYQNFFRQIYSKNPIEKFEDLNAQKIRVMGSDILIDTYQALNCNATTTAWTEMYSALQLGVCDGLDHVPSSVKSMAFYENLEYVTSPRLFVTPMFMVVSKPMYDKLPQAYQQLVDEGINTVLVPRLREMADQAFDDDLAWLLSEGGLKETECDIAAIHEAVIPVRDKYAAQQEDWVQELIKEILAK